MVRAVSTFGRLDRRRPALRCWRHRLFASIEAATVPLSIPAIGRQAPGIETNLGGSWFLKGEYRFTQLDEKTLSSGSFRVSTVASNYKVTDQPDIQTGRLVLSYKLNTTDYAPLK